MNQIESPSSKDTIEAVQMQKKGTILTAEDYIDINTIVLDLDDTLNSLTMHLLGQLGADVLPYHYDKYPIECGYGIIDAWSKLTGRPKPSVPDFWSQVTRGMWACAPRSEQFWLLEECAELVGQDNVIIATVPTKCPDCVAGKHDWIMRQLPLWCQRQYFITPRKHKLAHAGVLLIDDSDSNCDRFVVDGEGNPNGAAAITCPRPWNHLHEEDCDTYLQYQLQSFFTKQ